MTPLYTLYMAYKRQKRQILGHVSLRYTYLYLFYSAGVIRRSYPDKNEVMLRNRVRNILKRLYSKKDGKTHNKCYTIIFQGADSKDDVSLDDTVFQTSNMGCGI